MSTLVKLYEIPSIFCFFIYQFSMTLFQPGGICDPVFQEHYSYKNTNSSANHFLLMLILISLLFIGIITLVTIINLFILTWFCNAKKIVLT